MKNRHGTKFSGKALTLINMDDFIFCLPNFTLLASNGAFSVPLATLLGVTLLFFLGCLLMEVAVACDIFYLDKQRSSPRFFSSFLNSALAMFLSKCLCQHLIIFLIHVRPGRCSLVFIHSLYVAEINIFSSVLGEFKYQDGFYTENISMCTLRVTMSLVDDSIFIFTSTP